MAYELLYIIPGNFSEEELKPVIENIKKIINELGGKIIQEKNLGKRKLAYPIKHIFQGYYIVNVFNSEPENIKKIDQKIKPLPEVLRHLITKIKEVKVKEVKKRQTKKTEKEKGSKKIEIAKTSVEDLLKI
ncbi:30S ribosomal protein S6 [bacterium]|nr:30S ribosomal protein S6 [bacterium]